MNRDFEALAKSALTLQERMARWGRKKGGAEVGRLIANPVIEHWSAMLNTGGDSESFDRRLRWAGWERGDVVQALRDENLDFHSPLWLDIIAGVVERTAADFQSEALPPSDSRAWLDVDQPLPFQELFSSAVDYAYSCLAENLDRRGSTLSPRIGPTGTTALGRQLLGQITEISGFALFSEFEKFRPAGKNIWLKIKGGPRNSNDRRLYDQFIHEMGCNGLRTLFAGYPVLARMIGTRIEQWIEVAIHFTQVATRYSMWG